MLSLLVDVALLASDRIGPFGQLSGPYRYMSTSPSLCEKIASNVAVAPVAKQRL